MGKIDTSKINQYDRKKVIQAAMKAEEHEFRNFDKYFKSKKIKAKKCQMCGKYDELSYPIDLKICIPCYTSGKYDVKKAMVYTGGPIGGFAVCHFCKTPVLTHMLVSMDICWNCYSKHAVRKEKVIGKKENSIRERVKLAIRNER